MCTISLSSYKKNCLQQLRLTPDQAVSVGYKVSELDDARAVGHASVDCFIEKFSDLLDILPLQKVESIRDDEPD